MDLFLSLVFNIFPLYILIGLGFIAGRFFQVDRLTLANIVIFIIVPVVIFGYIVQLEINLAYMALPLLYYALLSLIALIYLCIGRKIYPDSRANLLSLTAACHNAGYFGLPVMISLFDIQWLAIYMFIIVGGVLFESTMAYYIAARGAFDVRQSLKRLMTYPSIYVVILGLLANKLWDQSLPEIAITYWVYFKGAYVVLGMMIIGAALAQARHFVFSWRFNALAFSGKFIVWPAFMGFFVALDIWVFQFYEPEIHTMLMLLSVMPPAAAVTAFATQFNTNPEKAATTVLAGTLFALIAIPLVLVLFGY